jgi:hypothetical protein
MNFEIHSFRNGEELLEMKHSDLWSELKEAIQDISDDELITRFELLKERRRDKKSISKATNQLIKEKLVAKGWEAESPIFQEFVYNEGTKEKIWRLDFAKDKISIEVSFNHGEALAWNLTKPVLASEYNHVEKKIQTEVGVIILATDDFKNKGGFDGAVGSYEKAIRYLMPMRDILRVPLVLIGLKSPKSFYIKLKQEGRTKVGYVTSTSKNDD